MKVTVRIGTIQEAVDLSWEVPELVNPYTVSEYQLRLNGVYIILVAEVAGVPVGFKVGYDRFRDGEVFYGWIGGVHPSYRKMGIATLLLEKMEVWCRLKGYRYLQFRALNKHKPMIYFGLDQGFDVVNFKAKEDVSMSKIYFQKKL